MNRTTASPHNISGILLAGGRSKRMGQNKARMTFRGRELYTYPLEVLERLCSEVLVSAPQGIFPDNFPFPIIPDIHPGLGPLAGIHSCLRSVTGDRAIVLSCDTPFITTGFLEALYSAMNDAPAIAGTDETGRPQPLAAIYRSSLWPLAEELLETGNYRMNLFLDRAGAKFADVAEMGFDPVRLFFNVNDSRDFRRLDHLAPPAAG